VYTNVKFVENFGGNFLANWAYSGEKASMARKLFRAKGFTFFLQNQKKGSIDRNQIYSSFRKSFSTEKKCKYTCILHF
jgi:hypothetical protein